jgi:hypothetical protein
MSKPVANINNLNIITFIKDIYQSLKHIDQSFNNMKIDIDTRLGKLEDQHQTILDRLANLEYLITTMNTKMVESEKMDKTLETELLDKMYMLNKASEIDAKLELKPKELTIGNILENSYTMLDINKTLQNDNSSARGLDLDLDMHLQEYQPIDLSSDSSFELPSHQVIQRDIQKEIHKSKQGLDNLLFG